MTPRIALARVAAEQARAIDAWWRQARTASPGLFAEELAAAFRALEIAPELGTRLEHEHVPDLRRVVLRATRYHVYYTFAGDLVRVLAVWSCRRGTGPDLSRTD